MSKQSPAHPEALAAWRELTGKNGDDDPAWADADAWARQALGLDEAASHRAS